MTTPRHRYDGERVWTGIGHRIGAFERVESDIDLGRMTRADFLTDEEHRRLITFAFTDHDCPVEFDVIEHRAHGLDCGIIGRIGIALPKPACAG